MDNYIQQQLNNIEQMALEIQCSIRDIYGFCAGMETATNRLLDDPPQYSVGYGNQNKSTIIQEIKAMIVELKIKGSVRQRANGLIELRTQALGSIYGRTKDEIEAKLTKALKEAKKQAKQKQAEQFSVPTNFDKFAMYWFDNFHKRKVADGTYKKNLDTYKRDIQKVFAKDEIGSVSPIKIQNFLDRFSDKARTKEIT